MSTTTTIYVWMCFYHCCFPWKTTRLRVRPASSAHAWNTSLAVVGIPKRKGANNQGHQCSLDFILTCMFYSLIRLCSCVEKLQFDTLARIHESCEEACVRVGFEKGSVNMKCDPTEFNRLNNCTYLTETFFPQCRTKCRQIDIGEPFVPVRVATVPCWCWFVLYCFVIHIVFKITELLDTFVLNQSIKPMTAFTKSLCLLLLIQVHEREVGLCFVDGYSLKRNVSFLATVDLCKEDYGSTRERLCSCSGSVLKLPT